jgi:hypothetical protein
MASHRRHRRSHRRQSAPLTPSIPMIWSPPFCWSTFRRPHGEKHVSVGARDTRARPRHESTQGRSPQSLPKLGGAWRTPRARLLPVLNNHQGENNTTTSSSGTAISGCPAAERAQTLKVLSPEPQKILWISQRNLLTSRRISYIMLTNKSGAIPPSTAPSKQTV